MDSTVVMTLIVHLVLAFVLCWVSARHAHSLQNTKRKSKALVLDQCYFYALLLQPWHLGPHIYASVEQMLAGVTLVSDQFSGYGWSTVDVGQLKLLFPVTLEESIGPCICPRGFS